MKEPLNTDKFVKNLMESMYGKDSMGDIDVPEAPNNDEIVVQHAKQLGDDFGLPTNLGNAWNPGKMVAEAHTEDHDEDEEAPKEEAPKEEAPKGKKLTAKQKQLDKNKNQKLDAEDFKMLRNENQEMESSRITTDTN